MLLLKEIKLSLPVAGNAGWLLTFFPYNEYGVFSQRPIIDASHRGGAVCIITYYYKLVLPSLAENVLYKLSFLNLHP